MMPEVPRVSGPGGPTEPEKKSADAAKFKEARAKVQKVSEVDPEQKKKRKRQGEEDGELMGAPTPRDGPVKSGISPMDLGSRSVRGPSSSSTTPTVPSSEKSSDEPGQWEEDQVHGPSSEKKREGIEKVASQVGIKKKGSPHVPPPHPKKEKTLEAHPKKIEEEEAPLVPMVVPPAKVTIEQKVKEKEIEQAAMAAATGMAAAPLMPSGFEGTAQVPPPSPVAFLPYYIMEVFERIVGAITVIQNSEISETSIHLTSPQFASSVFYGTEIIIRVHRRLAPQEFDINVIGASPKAVALMEKHIGNIQIAFVNNHFRLHAFRVMHRPMEFRRKGPVGDEKRDKAT